MSRGLLALPPFTWGGLGHGLTVLSNSPDNQFRMSILERLEQMEKRVAEMGASAANASEAQPQGEKPPGQVRRGAGAGRGGPRQHLPGQTEPGGDRSGGISAGW